MAKKKETESQVEDVYNDKDYTDLVKDLGKSIGAEILSDRSKSELGYIDTGILSLNYLNSGKFVGGGLPAGGCIEIFGDSSTGKTLIGTNVMTGAQKAQGVAGYLDAEETLSEKFAVKASKVDPNMMFVFSADTLEGCFNKIHVLIKKTRAKIPKKYPLVIVYDSIAVSPSEREFAETNIDKENDSKAAIKEAGAGADMPGERAKICSKELRKLPSILKENNVTIVFVNQIRQKIGFSLGYGDNTTTAGGGTSLKFYCTNRIELKRGKTITDDTGEIIGVKVNVNIPKNKVHAPFGKTQGVNIYFDKGIDPFSGLLEVLVKAKRIERVSPGNYTVCKEYLPEGTEEVKFKAAADANLVPIEILRQCPKMVDANSVEEIDYYVNKFGEAIEETNNETNEFVDGLIED